MGKRANREGTVYELPDGSWRAALTVERRGDGRLRRLYFRWTTQKSVLARLKAANLAARNDRLGAGPETTVAEHLRSWLQVRAGGLAFNTTRSYDYACQRLIAPGWAERRSTSCARTTWPLSCGPWSGTARAARASPTP